VLELEVIEESAAAITALDPTRAQILARLVEPGSATTVARALGLTRQKANYHLRALEDHGLVTLVEERPRRGVTERIVQATAQTYLIAPELLGAEPTDPGRLDRLSTRYLLALAARLVREVLELARGADRAGQPLATLAIDTEIRFRSAADRAAFTAELAAVVGDLTARYHDELAPRGRWHRLVIAAHPRPHPPSPEGAT